MISLAAPIWIFNIIRVLICLIIDRFLSVRPPNLSHWFDRSLVTLIKSKCRTNQYSRAIDLFGRVIPVSDRSFRSSSNSDAAGALFEFELVSEFGFADLSSNPNLFALPVVDATR